MKGPRFVSVFVLFLLAAATNSQNCSNEVTIGNTNTFHYRLSGQSLTIKPDVSPLSRVVWYFRTPRSSWTLVSTTVTTDNFEKGVNGLDLVVLNLNQSHHEMEIQFRIVTPLQPSFESKTVTILIGKIPTLTLASNKTIRFIQGSSSFETISYVSGGVPSPQIQVLTSEEVLANVTKFTANTTDTVIRNLDVSDNGLHFVEASNCFGKYQAMVNIEILVGISLEAVGGSSLVARCRNDVLVRCVALSFPEAVVTWKLGSTLQKRLSAQSHYSTVHFDGHRRNVTSVLTVKNVSREDTSDESIQCIAENELGKVELSFDLIVQCTPGPCGLAINVTNTSVASTVTPPEIDGNSAVFEYMLLLVSSNDSVIYNITVPNAETVNLGSLVPKTSYIVSCAARNRYGLGLRASKTFQTHSKPGVVAYMEVTDKNCTLVQLEIGVEETETGGVSVKCYDIIYNEIEPNEGPLVTLNCRPSHLSLYLETSKTFRFRSRPVNKYGAGSFGDETWPVATSNCKNPTGSPLANDDGFPVVVVAAVTGGIVFLLLTAIFVGVSVPFYNILQTDKFEEFRYKDVQKWITNSLILSDDEKKTIKGLKGEDVEDQSARVVCKFRIDSNNTVLRLRTKLRILQWNANLDPLLEDYKNVFTKIDHPNVARLYKFSVGDDVYKYQQLFAYWPCNRPLTEYLLDWKDERDSVKKDKGFQVALDIAKGMAYLEKKKIVHNFLCAASCIVSEEEDVRVSEYHLCVGMKGVTYQELVALLGDQRFRWLPNECVEFQSYGCYKRRPKLTHKSDVFAYGKTLCEVFNILEKKEILYDTELQWNFRRALEEYQRTKQPEKLRKMRTEKRDLRRQKRVEKREFKSQRKAEKGLRGSVDYVGGGDDDSSSFAPSPPEEKRKQSFFSRSFSRQASRMSVTRQPSSALRRLNSVDVGRLYQTTKESYEQKKKEYKDEKKANLKTKEYRKEKKSKKGEVATELKELKESAKRWKQQLRTQESSDRFDKFNEEICSEGCYQLMALCLKENPDSRPSFVTIVEKLEKLDPAFEQTERRENRISRSPIREENEDEYSDEDDEEEVEREDTLSRSSGRTETAL